MIAFAANPRYWQIGRQVIGGVTWWHLGPFAFARAQETGDNS